MSKPVMTTQDAETLERARREFRASVQAFDRTIQERKPIAEVDEALKTMNQNQAHYRSLAESLQSYMAEEGKS